MCACARVCVRACACMHVCFCVRVCNRHNETILGEESVYNEGNPSGERWSWTGERKAGKFGLLCIGLHLELSDEEWELELREDELVHERESQ